ncbi:MAG: hypothetical protein RL544_1660 [Bacteroidota bacterium]|jgi:hypothetical protein
MGATNYLKFFSLLAFIAFAAISCWATAESLHLLLSSWPLAFCWVVSVGFFIIASLGTKMIVDSLNQNVYIEKRGVLLFGGIILVVLFWLICVMPTNTHTFFFRNKVNEKVAQDITTTQKYLDQIKNNQRFIDSLGNKINDFDNTLEAKLLELKAEIENPLNPGNGPVTKKILKDFAIMLGVPNIEPLSTVGTSNQDRTKLYEAYREKIYAIKESKTNQLNSQIQNNKNQQREKDAEKAYNELDILQKQIKAGAINLNDAKEIEGVSDKINRGYAVIKANSSAVIFENEDKKAYTAENPVSKVKRLTSVFDVWKDFLAGAYAGSGFLFWIIIAILVDVAAFIFFDITFKK